MTRASKLKQNSHLDLRKAMARKSPSERLMAFLNHSRLMAQLKIAGQKSSSPKK